MFASFLEELHEKKVQVKLYVMHELITKFVSGLKIKGGYSLATRHSVEEHIQQCEDAIRIAQEEYNKAGMQEHYDDLSFTNSMQQLEQAYNDIAKLAMSCNGQQREQLHRMRLQLQKMQNNMTLLDH